MKNLLFSIAILITYVTLNAQNNGLFYYSFDKQIPLNIIENSFVVEFIVEEDEGFLTSNGIVHEKIANNLFQVVGNFNNVKNTGSGVYYTLPAYETDNGSPIICTTKLCYDGRTIRKRPKRLTLLTSLV